MTCREKRRRIISRHASFFQRITEGSPSSLRSFETGRWPETEFVQRLAIGVKLDPTKLLSIFIGLRLLQHLLERGLAYKNKEWFREPSRQEEAKAALNMSDEEMTKALAYSFDKYQFSRLSSWIQLSVSLAFLGCGGLGLVESLALGWASDPIIVGLCFVGILGFLSGLVDLPFDYYSTFVIEARHGFNKQTLKGFIIDRIKGVAIGVVLGGAMLAALLFVMEHLPHWWLWAWFLIFGINLIIAWIYPTLLAPLFNKFEPLSDGDLKTKLLALAEKVDFNADSISVMNASIRSTHGNAYFTGVFGKKKIVLFDTLVEAMNPDEICAVLAHELGHFKLNHIRMTLVRAFFVTGFMFYLLHLCLPLEQFYQSFGLRGVSNYGALSVFPLWFGIASFLLQPVTTWLSRRNEFAADAFALKHISDPRKLGDALLKLREKSSAMPLSHPLYSTVYHSHPPLLERLKAMRYI